MNVLKRIYTIGMILVVIAVIGFVYRNRPCTNFRQAFLKTPTQQISLALANSPQEQSRGLGGCTYVPQNSGMYFSFNPAQMQTFWMKDMVIPIDIVWIKNGVVVGVEKNVPNEPPATPDTMLRQYPSPGDVDAVLEIGQNKADIYGITTGVKLELTQGG